MNISDTALSITPSTTLAISSKAKQLQAEGKDVVDFGVGEPDFNTPVHIQDEAIKAIRNGMTRYTPPAGVIELKQAICDKLKEDNGLDYEPNQIVVSNGAKHSLSNIFAAILNPGDEVIIPVPYWVSYPEMVKLKGGVPKFLYTKKENHFKIVKQDLENMITAKTKAIIINSPSNPTGQVYTKDELEELVQLLKQYDIYIISDEMYEKLIYADVKHVSIASLDEALKEKIIIVNGVSKSYAMTGWRIGYTASNSKVAKAMSDIQSHETSNPNSIAQMATIAALKGPQECIKEMNVEFDKRRLYMVQRLNKMPHCSIVEPKGAFYVFVDISDCIGKSYKGNIIQNGNVFCQYLLEENQVAAVPGDAFGEPHFIRLSYAASMDRIELGMNRIEQFLEQLV